MGQAAQTMTGAEAMLRCLERQGVAYMWGISGGAVLPILDALVDSSIKLILVRHEQGATHMADGYARATGRPGVVLATSGPGATNTLTGILTAHRDAVPLIVITGQQIRFMLGKDAFQEADIYSISMPVVKHSYLVRETTDIARLVREAFHIATSGRPGPVLIDVPKDVSAAAFAGDLLPPMDLPCYRAQADADEACDIPVATDAPSHAFGSRTAPLALHIVDAITRLTRGAAMIVTDEGERRMCGSRRPAGSQPRQWLAPGGAGTMGFAFPAAIGAQFGWPDRGVWAVVDAGGFQMTMCELATAAIHRLPVKVVVLNHPGGGCQPDFAALADAYPGARGMALAREADMRDVLRRARAYTAGPCVINVAEVAAHWPVVAASPHLRR